MFPYNLSNHWASLAIKVLFSRSFPGISVRWGEDSLPFEVELLVLDVTEGLTTHITDMLRLFMDQNVL